MGTGAWFTSGLLGGDSEIKTIADWAGPYVKIESPLDGQTISGSVEIYGTITDDNPHQYWLVAEDALTGHQVSGFPGVVNESNFLIGEFLYAWDTTLVPDGDYVIKLEARDALGNKDPDQDWGVSDPEDPNDSIDWITVTVSNAPSKPTGMTIWKGHDPATRVEIGCGGITNQREITIDWDDNPELDIAYYQFDIKDKDDHARPTESEYRGTIRDIDGEYKYRVRAVDTLGNKSEPTDWCFVTLDRSKPNTVLTVSGSWSRSVEEKVKNPSFENFDPVSLQPDDWDTEGDVAVVDEENGVVPKDGSYMVKIGRETDPGNDLYFNSISQEIPNETKNISFWYNFFSEDYEGFDEPGFSVFLNGQEIYQIWAKDIDVGDSPNSSDWQQFFYDISHIDGPSELTLIFYAGNNDDIILQSWVYIDQVSTKELTVNSEAKFHLEASDSGTGVAVTYYQPNCTGDTVVYNEPFSLTPPLAEEKLCFWSVDNAGNEETPHKSVHVILDNTPPTKVENLEVIDYGDGTFSLLWTAPSDNQNNGQAVEYDLRYSEATISGTTDWDSLPKIDDSLFVDEWGVFTNPPSPRKSGEPERWEIEGLEAGVPYWFALKASDAAPNWSEMSNVASNGSTLVINEVYYDVGSTKGGETNNEWVELYNNADYDINLNGWQITDNNGTMKDLASSDLWLESGQFAVVTKNVTTWNYWTAGSPPEIPTDALKIVLGTDIGSGGLSNDGDRVELYSPSDSRVDEMSYGSDTTYFTLMDVDEGHSLARKEKGVDTDSADDWEDLTTPTPGTNPHSDPKEGVLETTLDFWLASDKKSVGFKVEGVSPFESLVYEIAYDSDLGDQGIGPSSIALSGEESLERTDITLGSCSTGGVCLYHTGIHRIHIRVVLQGPGMPERSLEEDLVY